jgi:Calx-beta domain
MTKGFRVALIAPLALAIGMSVPLFGSTRAVASSGLSYHFTAPPIAPAGSIGPGHSLNFDLRVKNGASPAPGGVAYVGYFQGGHVAGDSTVLQCAGGNITLPSTGSVSCAADSKGVIHMTYKVPAQPPAQGRADWFAGSSPTATSGKAVEHYVYCTVFRFNPSPITGSQHVSLTAKDGLDAGIANDTVYLSFKGAGSAKVAGTALTSTPTLFPTDSSGALIIAFTAGTGTGTIAVQDLRSAPQETNTDSYAPSAPVFSVGDNTVYEGDQLPGIPAQFTVSVSPVQPSPVTVKYVTLCGIGDKGCGEDFVQVGSPTTVTIPAGASSTTVLVRQFAYIGGNAGETYKEGYYVELVNPSVGIVGRSVGTGMLLPDVEGTATALPYLYTGSVAAMPTLGAAVPVYFTVTLGAQQSSPVTFSYTTSDGSAMASTDYTALSGTATIPANKTSVVIKVMLTSNAPPATDKVFNFTISSASGSLTIWQPSGTGTILAF